MGILEAINWTIIAINAIGLLLSIPSPPAEHTTPPVQQEITHDSLTHESMSIQNAP